MRELIIKKVISHLLESRYYGVWLRSKDDARYAHDETFQVLEALPDQMLLSLYTRLVTGSEIVPTLYDDRTNEMRLWVGALYGAMSADGSIHT